jgi:prepilin-type N-terminal cleavage/methylation domain-containing protein
MRGKFQDSNSKDQGNPKIQGSMLRADFQRALAESWNLSLPWDLRFGVWNFRARAAFTLIELLITITIISVLVAIGIPATERIVHKGRATHCLGNLRNLGAAMQLYLNDHNTALPSASRALFSESASLTEKPSACSSAAKLSRKG